MTMRRLAAIVVADVAGYSRLMHANEESTHSRFTRIKAEVIEPAIAQHGGRIVKSTGDGFLAEFQSAVAAVRSAIQFQAGVPQITVGDVPEARLAFRVGIHIGDVIVEEHDVYGDGVNIAARLEGLAEAGGILVSDVVQENVRGRLDAHFEDLGAQQVKNIARPIHVFRVIATVTPTSSSAPQPLTLPDKRLMPPPKPFVGVPPRIANFTGRDAEFNRLGAILLGGRLAAVTQVTASRTAETDRVAVQGLGGVGKTSFAVEYACRYRDLYAGVWWCPAETRIGLMTSLAGLATELDAAAANETDIEKAAKAALRLLSEQRATFLLVYDNVESPEDIADFLPVSGAHVLLTSRFTDWSGWAEEVALDVLPPVEAVAFLESRAGRQDASGAAMLAAALGRLPLALDHAAAYCKRTQMSFAAYSKKADRHLFAAPRGASYPRSVAATFNLAILEAVTHCAPAEPLIAYLAQCAPERIPITLIDGAVADEAERAEALLALAEVSLVGHDLFEDGTPALTVHRLVQAVARRRAEESGAAATAVERIVLRLAAIYPNDGNRNPASWPLCAQLTPHLLARCETDAASAIISPEQAKLLRRAGSYFQGRGAYSEAEPLFSTALVIGENALGPEHPDTAMSLNDFADLLHEQGDLGAARPLIERAVAIYEKTLGPEHPYAATSLSNFARLLQAEGDLAGARPLFERAVAIYEKTLGHEHPHTARCLNNLGLLLLEIGDLAGARPLCERSLGVCERVLGPQHPDTARSLINFARLLQAEGDLAGARPLFERALAILERALGPEHPHTARSLNNLGLLLHEVGDLDAARPLYERALAICEKALGPEHPDTGRCQSHFARLLIDTDHADAALALAKAALTTHERALGRNHRWTADSAGVTADALAAIGSADRLTRHDCHGRKESHRSSRTRGTVLEADLFSAAARDSPNPLGSVRSSG
jgi:class 3 adenylate cyclase/tetratricopeptide (TPR) repeat protein